MSDKDQWPLKDIKLKKFPVKGAFLACIFLSPILYYRAQYNKKVFMNKLRERDEKVNFQFEQFNTQFKLPDQHVLREIQSENPISYDSLQKQYLFVFYGNFKQFFKTHKSIQGRFQNLQKEFLYISDSDETKQTIRKVKQFEMESVRFAELIDESQDLFQKNTLYCISPEKTLLHAEEIKDLDYNYYLQTLNLKINKYLESNFMKTLNFEK